MTPHHNESISSIGYDLLSHAQETGEPNRLPLTTQLFPFLFLAARRMTTRQMSAWLLTNKSVKLSAAGISKGLQRPDLHLRRIAEHVQPLAAYITAAYHGNGETAETLLYGSNPATGRSVLAEMDQITAHDPEGRSEGVTEAFSTLWEIWDTIPEEVQWMCRPYFDFTGSSASDDSDDDSETTPEQSEP